MAVDVFAEWITDDDGGRGGVAARLVISCGNAKGRGQDLRTRGMMRLGGD